VKGRRETGKRGKERTEEEDEKKMNRRKNPPIFQSSLGQ